ncbi:MAG: M16 family metallopeptidase [Mangrovibacterium sp.]
MLDRTLSPEIQNVSKPDYIEPECLKLNNGIKIYATRAGREEMMRIDWVFCAGSWFQKKALTANLTCAMLQTGSAKYSSKEIAEIFDFHGAYIQTSCAHHQAVVSLICLKKHLESLLPVVEDFIKHPSFPEKEFRTLIARRKQRFSVDMEKVKVICQKTFAQTLFGNAHPYNAGVKMEDFNQITRADIQAFYPKHYHAQNCEIQLVGQYDSETSYLLSQHFGGDDWLGEASQEQSFDLPSNPKSLVKVHKEGAIQSAIRVGKIMLDNQHPDYFDLKITIALLGGYFGSRLMKNIREEKGYTYGIGAGYVNNLRTSYFLISTEVAKQYEEDTLNEIYLEIERLQHELVSDDELNTLKQYLMGEFLRSFDGAFQQLATFRYLHNFKLNYKYYDQYFQRMANITAEDIRQVACKYLNVESLTTVVVGNEQE